MIHGKVIDKITTVDCSYHDEHKPRHEEHPETGRLVCMICHPPMPKIAKPREIFARGRCPECELPLPGPHRGTCSQSMMHTGLPVLDDPKEIS